MKKQLLALGLVALALPVCSQSFQWARNFGYGASVVKAQSVAIDAGGNTYTVGFFSGSIDVDPSASFDIRPSAGASDIFIIKTDPTGALVWANTIGSNIFDEANDVAIDGNGNITVTGSFSGTVDFDPGPGTDNRISAGDADIFVATYSTSGALLWVSEMGGPGTDVGMSITANSMGNTFVLGGYFDGTCDFMPGSGVLSKTSNGQRDGFAVMMGSGGSVSYCYTYGGSGDDYVNGTAYDQTYVYLTGSFTGTADFDHTSGTLNLTAAGQTDIFIMKFSAVFNSPPLLAQAIGGAGYDEGASIITNGYERILVTGYFEGSNIDFDLSVSGTDAVSSNGSLDAFVLCYNTSNNTHVYAHGFGGTGTEMGYDVCFDNTFSAYITGMFGSTTDFDPGSGTTTITNQGADDCFFVKLDATGNLVFADPVQSNSNEAGYGVACNAGGTVTYTGFFNGAADFDPTTQSTVISPYGFSDAFVVKYSNCTNTASTITVSVCDTFMLNNTAYTATGTYTEVIPNVGGCDSTITLNLTIQNSAGQTYATGCGFVSVNNTNYYTSGIYYQLLQGANQYGCDSTVMVNATVYNVNTGLTLSNDTLYPQEPAVNIQTITWIDCATMQAVGSLTPWFVPTVTGNYAAIITTTIDNGSCTDTTQCMNVIVSGIAENAAGMAFTLSPNPNNGTVMLQAPVTVNNARMTVTDVTGRVIYTQVLNGVSSHTFTFAGDAGMYFVTLENDSVKTTRRMIRN